VAELLDCFRSSTNGTGATGSPAFEKLRPLSEADFPICPTDPHCVREPPGVTAHGREPRRGNLDDETDRFCVIAMTRGLCWLPAQCFCRFRCWRPGSWCCWFSSGITAHSGASGVAGAGIAASADGRIHPRGRSRERVVVCGAAPLGVRTTVRDRMLVPVRTPPRSRITTLRREGATITPIRQPRLQPWP